MSHQWYHIKLREFDVNDIYHMVFSSVEELKF